MSVELGNTLKLHGIGDSDQLLKAALTPAARQDLAKAMGVETTVILELANRADLARVKGIGEVFSDLLEQAGVDSERVGESAPGPLVCQAGRSEHSTGTGGAHS